LLCCKDLLNIIRRGFAIFSGEILSILWFIFSSISKLDEESVTLPQFDSKKNNIIHEIHITENEIIDVIQILDSNKATGPDKISHKMHKISPEKIISNIINILISNWIPEWGYTIISFVRFD
jgi:signal-transduction protein with cAMP-binding, CBS, and nucleotidyltransferase domain